MHWLPKRVVRCGKAIGVTMEELKGRWASSIEYAQSREKHNQTKIRKRNFKRKGERELNDLCCSINYNKVRDRGARHQQEWEEKSRGFFMS